MKRILSFVLVLLISFTFFIIPLSVSALDTVNISAENCYGNRGDIVKISINLSRAGNMQALGLDLKYDHSILELISANEGNLVVDGQVVINSSSLGKIVFSYVSASPSQISSGSILDLQFKIKPDAKYGKSMIDLDVKEVCDGALNKLGVTQTDGSVMVNAPMLEYPRNITISQTYSNALEVTWDFVEEATGYNIYVDGKKINESEVHNSWYIIQNLDESTNYSIQISSLNYITESYLSEKIIGTTDTTKYTVVFLNKEFEKMTEYVVPKGATVIPPDAPEIEGYSFKGWKNMSYDESRNIVIDDFSNITNHLTVYAWYENVLLLGDVNSDGEVNILDATFAQMQVARYKSEGINLTSCDVDKDGEITIQDATAIQMFVAKMIPNFDSL